MGGTIGGVLTRQRVGLARRAVLWKIMVNDKTEGDGSCA